MSRREKLYHIRFSEEEDRIVKKNAEKLNMQVRPYIRAVAQNPIIENINYSIISEHTKEMAEVRNTINRIAFTIAATNNYQPKEMKNIVEMMNKLFEGENKLIREIIKERTRQYEKSRSEAKRNEK